MELEESTLASVIKEAGKWAEVFWKDRAKVMEVYRYIDNSFPQFSKITKMFDAIENVRTKGYYYEELYGKN